MSSRRPLGVRRPVVVLVLASLCALAALAPAATAGTRHNVPEPLAAAIQQAELTPPAGAEGDEFGVSVAVEGDVALVGACGETVGGDSQRGAVYVYTRSGGHWTLRQRLTAGDGAEGDAFGSAVALDGDTVLIGAPNRAVDGDAFEGAAYVFRQDASGWTQSQVLTGPDGDEGDFFGGELALDGDTAVIGADGASRALQEQGLVWVFVQNGGTWAPQQCLLPDLPVAHDHFGTAVALDGDTILVGSFIAGWVFTRSGGAWTQRQKLTPPGGKNVGQSVALGGDTALLGAPFTVVGGHDAQGAVYVYTGGGGSWTLRRQLTAADGATADWFGYTVALSGDRILVGAHLKSDGEIEFRGAAYVFKRGGDVWSQQEKLIPADCGTLDRFGVRVALSGTTALIGAEFKSVGVVPKVGAAYVYVLSCAVTPSVVGGLGGHGTITPASPQSFDWGSQPVFTFRPDAGYAIRAVLVDGARVGLTLPNAYAFPPLTSDHSISVEFAAQRFTITSAAGRGGTIDPAGTVSLTWGGAQSYAVRAEAGYHIADVRVDGRSVGAVASYSFTNVTASHTIAASFAPDSFTITALVGASGHGTVTPSGTSLVLLGATPTYLFTPQRGYYASRLTLDGVPVAFTAPNRYTFAPISGSHVLQVFFTAGPR